MVVEFVYLVGFVAVELFVDAPVDDLIVHAEDCVVAVAVASAEFVFVGVAAVVVAFAVNVAFVAIDFAKQTAAAVAAAGQPAFGVAEHAKECPAGDVLSVESALENDSRGPFEAV